MRTKFIFRSSVTGRFVTAAFAKAHPAETTKETVVIKETE